MIHRVGVSMSRLVAFSAIAAIPALIQTASCSGDVTVSTAIGPEGGTVEGPDGVQVVIPAGALAKTTSIVIRTVSASSAPAAPGGLAYANSVYSFEPHGLAFAQPVQVRLPAAGGALAVLHASCTANTEGASQCSAWDPPLAPAFQGGLAQVSTQSFSLYAAAAPPGGQGGAGGAGGGPMTTTSTGGCGGMSAASSYTVSTAPITIAAVDLNGDGKPDLAVTSGYGNGNAVSVLINHGDGTFADAVQIPLGATYNQFVAAGDLNGDGKADLVVANGTVDASGPPNRIDVLLNQGNGTFGAPVSYMVGSRLGPLAVADVNGDGKPDVIATDQGSLLVMLNGGSGTLGAAVSYAAGSEVGTPVVKDLDGDGKPDIAVAGATGVSVLRNAGGGMFSAAVTFGAGQMPTVVAVADLDGDGKPDLAVTDQGSGTIQVLRNLGGGTFAPAVGVPVGTDPFGVAAADVDGDGKTDLVVTLNGNSTVQVFFNSGGGMFTPGPASMVGVAPEALALVDLNGDGKLDGAIGVAMGDTVEVLLGLVCQ